jgi:carnitine-CoA ligase
MSVAAPRTPFPTLWRGRGAGLGPHVSRFPLENRTLLHVLQAQAAERGAQTWLTFDGRERLTFGRAWEQVAAVAHALIDAGAEGGQVALLLRNQIEYLPALLGTGAAGGRAVPLNPDARGPLLEYVIVKSESRVIVVRVDLLDRLAELDSLGEVTLVVTCGDGDRPGQVNGIPVVAWEEWLAGRPQTLPRPLPAGWDEGLIAFTSGTTGRSKGVVFPHSYLFLYSGLETDSLGHSSDDVLTTALPLCHMAGLSIVACSALHAGCQAHLKSRFSVSRFWDDAAADGATFAIIFGPMAAMLLKTVPQAPPHRVQNIFCVPFPPGGEEFERRYGVKLLWQGYGMTEVMPHPMPRQMESGVPYDTIGHAARFVEYGAVDEHDRVLGAGQEGELVYRTLLPHAMAAGYYKEPEATANAFRNFMFHTGDLGYVDDDGRVHYLGRRQDRIRRRGENVSADELEFVALQHPDVLEAAAFGVPAELGEHEVKLDVVMRESGPSLTELHSWLVGKLPRYMVPRYLQRRTLMPKTPTQKIEKFKLAAEGVNAPEVEVFEQPRRA